MDPPAALAALYGVFNLLGLLLIGIDLNFSVDIHVILAPVSNNHCSVINGCELIGTIGLESSFDLTSLISSISWHINLTQVCLIRLIIFMSANGFGLSGGFGSGGTGFSGSSALFFFLLCL